MAAVNCAKKAFMGAFPNEAKLVRGTYDFAVDGGLSTNTYKIFEASVDCVVIDGSYHVKTTFDSAGDAATVLVGVTGGDTDALLAIANDDTLTAGLTGPIAAAGRGVKLALGDVMAVTIGTEALTSGAIEFMLVVVPLTAL